MPFPHLKKVKFKQNVIDQVVCEVRYPPILSVVSEYPTAFQKAIGTELPYYREGVQENYNFSISRSVNASMTPVPYHCFTDRADNPSLQIDLHQNALAVTMFQKYATFTEFKKLFTLAYEALCSIYAPINAFTRIGLRYIDVIPSVFLEKGNYQWSDLIRQEILGLMATSNDKVRNSVKGINNLSEVVLPDIQEGIARIVTSFVRRSDNPALTGIKIDSDYSSTTDIQQDKVVEVLDSLHVSATNGFRYMISDVLYGLLEPEV